MLMDGTSNMLGEMINSQKSFLEISERRHELRNWEQMGGS
jgi:hypothetical protein